MDEILFGKIYYKLRQGLLQTATANFITNCEHDGLLQIATGITNCNAISNCNSTHIFVLNNK